MDLKAVYEHAKEIKEYETIAIDMKKLIANDIIDKTITSDKSDYKQLKEVRIRYRDFLFHKHKTKNKFAYINQRLDGSKMVMYELECDDLKLVRDLADLFKQPDINRSSLLIHTLEILGWIVIVLGIIISILLSSQEGGGLFFFVGFFSSLTASIWFFVGAHILKHLTDINANINT